MTLTASHRATRTRNVQGCSWNSLGEPLSTHLTELGNLTRCTPSSAVAADDRHDWYYPAAHQYDGDQDGPELDSGTPSGNWGNKRVKGARWVRRGKLSAWGPGRAEWEVSTHMDAAEIQSG